jgi:hypothetical protein
MGPPIAEDSVAVAVRSTHSPPLLPMEPMVSSAAQRLQTKQDAVVPDSVDALLVQELNRMSFQEREGISEEMHGVHCMAVQETPEFVKEKLDALDTACAERLAESYNGGLHGSC